MPYVFVVHSRLVLTRLPLAKAFLQAILTVNTYPFDWHLRREYMDIQPSIWTVIDTSRSCRASALLSTSLRRRHLGRHLVASAVTDTSHRFGSGVTGKGVILFWRHPSAVTLFVTRRYLKDKLSSSSYPCFISVWVPRPRSPLPPLIRSHVKPRHAYRFCSN